MADVIGIVDEMEWEAQEVAKVLYAQRNRILDALQPDGRPWGMPKRTTRDQVRHYVEQGLHDNNEQGKQAWANWIRERAQGNIQRMTEQGITPQEQASISPYTVAITAAYWYSARMERALRREENKVVAAV